MTRWEIFQLVGVWLQSAILREAPEVPAEDFPWELAVEAASHHMVAPAVGWALLKNEAVVGEVADYFETILDLNRKRNETLLAELETSLRALNAAGIRPILLKGAAFLAEGSYPDIGMRMLADLDILVPQMQLHAASNALIDVGFSPPRTELPTPAGHHHLPAQTKAATGVTVELHREPTEPPFRGLLCSRLGFESAEPIRFRGCDALLLSATDRVAHNIVHGQLSDRNHRRGVPELRQLLDLAILRASHEDKVNWPELQRRFQAADFDDVLADTFTCAEFLLGLDVPEGLNRGDGPIRHMRRTIERTGGMKAGAALVWAFRDAATALRSDPRRLLTAIRRRRWRTAARPKKW